MDFVSYSEMRTIFDLFTPEGKPIAFSLTYVTADRNKGTGGEFITIPHCIKVSNLKRKHIRVSEGIHGPSASSGTVNSTPEVPEPVEGTKGKDPLHWQNQTTNIAILAKDELTGKLVNTGEIRKIHYKLILEINGKRVI